MANKELKDMSFSEALAVQAQSEKAELVWATLKAFKEGEPSAFKMVSQALLDAQYSEEANFPLSDERIEEIICHIADNLRAVKG